jgi:hypothetical protein
MEKVSPYRIPSAIYIFPHHELSSSLSIPTGTPFSTLSLPSFYLMSIRSFGLFVNPRTKEREKERKKKNVGNSRQEKA